jgi:hypothetical protein
MADRSDPLQALGLQLQQDTRLLWASSGLQADLHAGLTHDDFQSWQELEHMVDQLWQMGAEWMALETWLTSGFLPIGTEAQSAQLLDSHEPTSYKPASNRAESHRPESNRVKHQATHSHPFPFSVDSSAPDTVALARLDSPTDEFNMSDQSAMGSSTDEFPILNSSAMGSPTDEFSMPDQSAIGSPTDEFRLLDQSVVGSPRDDFSLSDQSVIDAPRGDFNLSDQSVMAELAIVESPKSVEQLSPSVELVSKMMRSQPPIPSHHSPTPPSAERSLSPQGASPQRLQGLRELAQLFQTNPLSFLSDAESDTEDAQVGDTESNIGSDIRRDTESNIGSNIARNTGSNIARNIGETVAPINHEAIAPKTGTLPDSEPIELSLGTTSPNFLQSPTVSPDFPQSPTVSPDFPQAPDFPQTPDFPQSPMVSTAPVENTEWVDLEPKASQWQALNAGLTALEHSPHSLALDPERVDEMLDAITREVAREYRYFYGD